MKRRIYSGWELLRLQREIEEVLATCSLAGQHAGGEWTPPVDILECPGRFVILLNLPGLRAADVRVSLSDRVLHIVGRKGSPRRHPEHRRYFTVERHQGRFEVEIWLPGPVSRESTSARLRGGVLEVTLPRIAERRNSVHEVTVTDEEP